MAYLLIDPESKLDWQHSWDDYLAAGDTIVSRQWSITPMNEGSPSTPILTGDTTDSVFVEGFVAGKIYRLKEHIVTTAGVEDDRTIVLRCEDQ